jgi:hypothetical protein
MLYAIHGAVLRQLMIDSFKMEVLSTYGAEEYKTGERHHLAIAMLELPWNDGCSYEDMLRDIDEDGYDVERLIDDQMDAFWTPLGEEEEE